MNLGLSRIQSLLSLLGNPEKSWKAIHVAGTNGKGSVCAYISAVLHANGIRTGRFTSPHLISRGDGIVLDEKTVDQDYFNRIERHVKKLDKEHNINASSFELLTTTAFEIFKRRKVEVGVVEVGLGGRLDATNVFSQPLASVITRIGIDHSELLGNTLENIAVEKAGIMKKGSACIIDSTNEKSVVELLLAIADSTGCEPVVLTQPQLYEGRLHERHFPGNVASAMQTLQILRYKEGLSDEEMLRCIDNVQWSGRYEEFEINVTEEGKKTVLLDGAHNLQAAQALARYVNNHYRGTSRAITWVYASSSVQKTQDILKELVTSGDTVIGVEFTAVEGMPWVQPVPGSKIKEVVETLSLCSDVFEYGTDMKAALGKASNISNKIVVCGSLYLISDIYRLAGVSS